jgi:hypothetical protein
MNIGARPIEKLTSHRPKTLSSIAASVLSLLCVLGTACEGGDNKSESQGGGGATSGTCASAGTKMCERACACGTDGTCKTGSQGSLGSTTLTWDNLEDCKGAYVGLACRGSGPPGVDFAACESAVTAAACTGDVFVVPKICDPPKDGG